MSSLPEGIIENIFTRLPVESIARFRCVSKYWLHQFQNPNFIKNHLNHAIRINKFNILLTKDNSTLVLSLTSSPFSSDALIIDYPLMAERREPQIQGSSNGLVSIAIGTDDEGICIWNPATGEYKLVPKLSAQFAVDDSESDEDFERDDDFEYVSGNPHGFGFDSKNDDYKLIRIAKFDGKAAFLEARLYSLASNSWKNLGFVPYGFRADAYKGFLLKGVLHWVATDLRTEPKSAVIVCFDIADETFYDVPLPPHNKISNLCVSSLGVWEGKLCLLTANHMEDPDTCTHQNDHLSVWTMMNNKWSKHSKITAHMTDMVYTRPIQTLENGEILFTKVDERFHFISYDPKLERARALYIDGFPEESEDAEDIEVETYIETLVALNSGTYVGQ